MISVVIPSRLARMPDGRFWLDRSLEAVRCQSGPGLGEIEIVVGLDAGATLPDRLLAKNPRLIGANAKTDGPGGQAAALNAALAAISGDIVAILEDDDWWEVRHLALAADALGTFDFVSSSQRCVDPAGTHIGVFGAATPSGWVMRRAALEKAGPFDEAYRFHLDSEWLGRLNLFVERRGHFIEASEMTLDRYLEKRSELRTLVALAKPAAVSLLRTGSRYTQVVRTENPKGGVSSIRSDPLLGQRSQLEYSMIERRYGVIPW